MIRRGIVVTHGVGEQKRADQLDTVVEPLMVFVGGALGYENVSLVARTHREEMGGRIASATIHLTRPGAPDEDEEWHVREAWWADTFRPSDSKTVLGWAVMAFWFHVQSTWESLVLRNLRRFRGRSADPLTAEALLGRPVDPATHLPLGPDTAGIWRIPRAGRLGILIDFLAWFLITFAYFILIYVPGVLLILPLYVFLLSPGISLVSPSVAGAIQRALVNAFTLGIGDQQAMTNRRVAVSAAANVVCAALQPFLDSAYLDEHRLSYDTVTLIAHSGGCIVSYEALAGSEVRGWLAARPRRVTWVTAGSGLNLAWRMRAKGKLWDRYFYERRIDPAVNWLNIYARYDPVPQGAPPRGMVEAIVGRDSAAPQPAGVPAPELRPPYVNLRVANDDLPLTDHGLYWWNFEEAMSRIVHVVVDSELGTTPLDPDDVSFVNAHMLSHTLEEAVVQGGDARRNRVSLRQGRRLLLLAGAVVILILWARPVGDWITGDRVDLLGFPGFQDARGWLGDHVPDTLGRLDFRGLRNWLVGAIAFGYLGLILSLVLGLIRQWIDHGRSEMAGGALQSVTPVQTAPRRLER